MYVFEERELIIIKILHLSNCSVTLTAKAFSVLEQKTSSSKNVFVAMSFDAKLHAVYEQGIKIGIEQAGYTPIRIDKKEHNAKICDEIIAEIRNARFIIADFTDHKNGVYYEAGFAQGLGLPVIWTCRESDMDDLHFDIQQYNCIVWQHNQLSEFAEKIKNRIHAVIQ